MSNSHRRSSRFVYGLLLVIAALACLLLPALQVVRNWRKGEVMVIHARLTSTGIVRWGNEQIPLADFGRHLQWTANTLKLVGAHPSFRISCYSDTRDQDINALRDIAMEAGCESVKVEHNSWPSPTPPAPGQ